MPDPTLDRTETEATFSVVDAPLGSLTAAGDLPFTPTTIILRSWAGHVYVVAQGPCVRKDGTPGLVHRQTSWTWRKDQMPAWLVDGIHETADFMAGKEAS